MQEVAAAVTIRRGSLFGRKWLLSAASKTPRASQNFSVLSNPPPPGEQVCRHHPVIENKRAAERITVWCNHGRFENVFICDGNINRWALGGGLRVATDRLHELMFILEKRCRASVTFQNKILYDCKSSLSEFTFIFSLVKIGSHVVNF